MTRCKRINEKTVVVVLICFFVNVRHSQMADNVNHMDLTTKQNQKTSQQGNEESSFAMKSNTLSCPLNKKCHELNPPCVKCNFSYDCVYGQPTEVNCEVDTFVNCEGTKKMKKSFVCRYCYQTDRWEHTCEMKANCNSVSTPRAYYLTNCTVHDNVLCLGHRTFNKNVNCNWTGGYKWLTALILSVTLGGFGADRFYLGHWQEGIGKLFSFGGLGVWTLIDVILISLHYLGPADGSLYI